MKFASDGTVLATFGGEGSAPGQFEAPSGVTIDDTDGSIIVLDSDNNRIQVLTPGGQPNGMFGAKGSGPGQFSGPTDLVTDAQGNIYIADNGNSRIDKLTVK
ncbi:MAG: NHL repeat-containing protein [Chloroflexi bacterium]|nr:NHL repeat-containing protein [Chloroflexota bacterium]